MTTLEHAKEAFKNLLLVHDKNKSKLCIKGNSPG